MATSERQRTELGPAGAGTPQPAENGAASTDAAMQVGSPCDDSAVSTPDGPEVWWRSRWISAGLGRKQEDLVCVRAGGALEEEGGQLFYSICEVGLTVAVRADGFTAHVTGVEPGSYGASNLRETLGGLNITDIDREAVRALRSPARTPTNRARVATGRLPRSMRARRIDLFDPRQPGDLLGRAELARLSAELGAAMQSDDPDFRRFQETRAFAVGPGDMLARAVSPEGGEHGRDVFGRDIAPAVETDEVRLERGWNVELSPVGEFRALCYGYVCLLGGALSVVPPLRMDRERIHLYWLLLDDRAHPVTIDMLRACAAELGVAEPLGADEVCDLTERVRAGEHQCGCYEVARGVEPEHGRDAEVEILVDVERRAGVERADGSIDFREVSLPANAKADQLIARRLPPVAGREGRDLVGNTLSARAGGDTPLAAGDNVRIDNDGTQELFFATLDGAVRHQEGEISVAEVVAIPGDVAYNTGNLFFDGEIFVDGSVTEGFSVKAGGPVTISGTVQPGCEVESGADVTVGKGIVGERTRVRAAGSVRAQFVQEARITAMGDIVLGNFAYHASLQAGRRVTVAQGSGSRGGSILGGETWALQGMKMHIAGSPAHTRTLLVAGLEPGQGLMLDRMTPGIAASYQQVLRILRQFSLPRIDVSQILTMIRAAQGPHRKLLCARAVQLGELVTVYQRLLAKREALRVQIHDAASRAEIRIDGSVHEGVEIRLGERHRLIKEGLEAARFHIGDNGLCDR